MKLDPGGKLVDQQAAAALSRRSASTIRKHVKPVAKDGKSLLYRTEDVEALDGKVNRRKSK